MILRLFILVLILASAYLLPSLETASNWDETVVATVAAGREPGWTSFFRFVSGISDTRGFLVALILPGLVYFWKRRWVTGLWYLLGVGALKLSISGLKLLIGRLRPLDGLDFYTTLSMPSGHAANAVIIFGLLAVFFWPRIGSPLGRFALMTLSLIAIFLVGFSRVYLGVHYPSDVIVGTLYTATGLWILQGMRKDVFTLWT